MHDPQPPLDRAQSKSRFFWYLLGFFLLAYLISWSLSLFAAPGLLPFAVPPLVATLAGFLYHFGPSLAGIILTAVEAGRVGVKTLLRSLGRVHQGIGWYAFVILYPFALRLAVVGLDLLLGGKPPAFFGYQVLNGVSASPLLMAVPLLLGTLIFAGLAEEIGWRGYALPRLQSRLNPLLSTLVLAAVWAPWHYNPFNFPVMRPVIPEHILSTLGMALILTWIYNGTQGSLWMVVLFHGISNFTDWAVPTSSVFQGDRQAYLIFVVLNLVVGLVLLLGPGRKKPGWHPQMDTVEPFAARDTSE